MIMNKPDTLAHELLQLETETFEVEELYDLDLGQEAAASSSCSCSTSSTTSCSTSTSSCCTGTSCSSCSSTSCSCSSSNA